LRGPQGTLRGVTSPSGAITLVTKAPSFNEIEGTVEQTFGERDLSNSQFGVSLPIIEDKLAMRIAGLYDHNKNDGIKNIVTGQENASQTRSGRMTLGLRATESLEAQLVYQYRFGVAETATSLAAWINTIAARWPVPIAILSNADETRHCASNGI
jgi:iron complex outermembrane receptor protein